MTRTTPSSRFRATARRASIAALASATLLSGCATPLPTPGELPDTKATQRAAVQRFVDDGPVSIERVPIPKSTLRPQSARSPLPANISSMAVDVSFPGTLEANLGTLVTTLSAVNLQVGFQWTDSQKGEAILSRRLPFLGFQGTVGELVQALRTGLGVVAWYENGMIFLSDSERYSISMPQNKELMDSVAAEIKEMGARDVVTSLRGGKILYSATPTVQDDQIGPFLDRMSRNLAVVNLQVAVVSLALNDNSTVGFDWNKFAVAFDNTTKGITAATEGTSGEDTAVNNGTGIGSSNDDDDGTGVGVPGIGTGIVGNDGSGTGTAGAGKVIDLTASGIAFSQTSLGSVFGTYGALTVAGAINFLSNFGNTNVTQNVTLKTLSGSEVTLRSGQEVPYVSGVSNTSSGTSGNTVGSSQTDKVETGLTISSTPLFDSESSLVTLDVDVELNSILDFVELDAGNEIGSFTQPLVQDQKLTNIVRVEAGKTVVIGGLQYDSQAKTGTEPAFLRDRLTKAGRSLGQRSNNVTRNALFIVLRPAVTIYVPTDGASVGAAYGGSVGK